MSLSLNLTAVRLQTAFSPQETNIGKIFQNIMMSPEEIEKILSRVSFEELSLFSERRNYSEKMTEGDPGDTSLSRHEAEVTIPMRAVETSKAFFCQEEM